ncbi:hypothetical protein Tco_0909438 [Tanacetum coccineum]|uniref:Uncharacterized protein n=1 Tax=Tanacetum coccineum TaxID=301880 RepID=A0ABQ5CS47_9ASTR
MGSHVAPEILAASSAWVKGFKKRCWTHAHDPWSQRSTKSWENLMLMDMLIVQKGKRAQQQTATLIGWQGDKIKGMGKLSTLLLPKLCSPPPKREIPQRNSICPWSVVRQDIGRGLMFLVLRRVAKRR